MQNTLKFNHFLGDVFKNKLDIYDTKTKTYIKVSNT